MLIVLKLFIALFLFLRIEGRHIPFPEALLPRYEDPDEPVVVAFGPTDAGFSNTISYYANDHPYYGYGYEHPQSFYSIYDDFLYPDFLGNRHLRDNFFTNDNFNVPLYQPLNNLW